MSKITKEEYEDAQNVVWDYEEQLKEEANKREAKRDCATCVYIDNSKYVAPCYGCRDNDTYGNYVRS